MAAKNDIGIRHISGNYWEVFGPGNRPTTVANGRKEALLLARVRRQQQKIHGARPKGRKLSQKSLDRR